MKPAQETHEFMVEIAPDFEANLIDCYAMEKRKSEYYFEIMFYHSNNTIFTQQYQSEKERDFYYNKIKIYVFYFLVHNILLIYNKINMTITIKCDCKNEFQDKEYGDQKRLANIGRYTKEPEKATCTVCGKVHALKNDNGKIVQK